MRKEINFYYFFYALSCIFIYLRLEIHFGSDIKAPFTDDFYYYLTTARNLINYKIISFDQISITNGFQPLWFIIIAFLKFLISDEILLNSFIIILIFILSFLSYVNFKNFFKNQGYSEKSSNFISVSISFLSLFFSKNGMEISLAIFLFSESIKYFYSHLIIFSIFAFLTFLARLEFIIFYFVLLFDEVFISKNLFKLRYIINLLVLPFLISFYLILNYFYFQSFLPESGIAKSLSKELRFNFETFSFLQGNGLGMKFISSLFYLNIFGLFFIFSNKLKKFTKLVLITNLIFFTSNSLRSAWPLWTWHFFFLSISSPMIIDDLLKYLKLNLLKHRTILISLFFAISYLFLFLKNTGVNNDHILNIATKISSHYKNSKYERFAMGDMAGKTSYLLDKKLVQLEGLVAGKKVIYNIANELSLCKLFKDLKIEIYLASKLKNFDSKFYIEEPSQKSKNVKKMRAILLNEPEKVFVSGDIEIFAFNLRDEKNCIDTKK